MAGPIRLVATDSGGAAEPTLNAVDMLTGTLLDPASLVSSSSTVSGVTTVTHNQVVTGNETYNWASGSNITMPRWYLPLNDGDGVRLTSDDTFTMWYELTYEVPTSGFDSAVVFGICEDPTSTVLGTLKGSGVYSVGLAAAVPAMGAHTINASTTSSSASNKIVRAVQLIHAGRIGSPAYHTLTAAQAELNAGSRNANATFTAATDLFLFFGTGARNNTSTIASGADVKCKLRYAVSRVTF